MALAIADRVLETSTTTGAGTLNLDGAKSGGYQTFVAGIGTTNTCHYCIVNASADEWEVGLGTVTDATPDTLSRDTILDSSNSGSAVVFSAGTKDVFAVLPAMTSGTDQFSLAAALATNGNDITGDFDFTGTPQINGNQPTLLWREADATANNRIWSIRGNNEDLLVEGRTDLLAGGGNLFKFTRVAEQVNTFEAQNSAVTWLTLDNLNKKVNFTDSATAVIESSTGGQSITIRTANHSTAPGDINLSAGDATSTSSGGNIYITGGDGGAASNEGFIFLTPGTSSANNAGRVIVSGATGASDTATIEFREAVSNGFNSIGLRAPTSISANRTWVLPDDDPSAVDGRFLTTGSTGTLSFGIPQVVDDVSPQLGGDLDTQQFDITGDFSNATVSARTGIVTTTTNGNTSVYARPNGTATTAVVGAFNDSDPDNSAYAAIFCDSTAGSVKVNKTGTGADLPLVFEVGGWTAITIPSPNTNPVEFGRGIKLTAAGSNISGDFSNATVDSRVGFQTSTVNGDTALHVRPNGTADGSYLILQNAPSWTGSEYALIGHNGLNMEIASRSQAGTTADRISFQIETTEVFGIETDGTLTVPAAANYETLVTADDDIPNKKYVDDAVAGVGGGINNVIEDTTPQLGGNLDVNGNTIVSVANGNIHLTPDGTGYIGLNSTSGYVKVGSIAQDVGGDLRIQWSSGTAGAQGGKLTFENRNSGTYTSDLIFRRNQDSFFWDVDTTNLLQLTDSGDLLFAAGDITGDFDFGVDASPGIRNRDTNGSTYLPIRPSGTGTISGLWLQNQASYTGGEYLLIWMDGTKCQIDSGGTTAQPIQFAISSSPKVTLETDGTLAANTVSYETLVTADNDIPNKKYVDDAITAGGGGINNVIEDLTPQLGGDLDTNGKLITSASGGNITIRPDTTGFTIIGEGSNYTDWSATDTDIDGLFPGSTFGTLIEGRSSGHFTIGIRDNGVDDQFGIVSGSGNYTSDSLYDKKCFSVRADGETTVNGDFIVAGLGGTQIRSDFSSAVNQRTVFVTTTTNSSTNLGVAPNGTSDRSYVRVNSKSDLINGEFMEIGKTPSYGIIRSSSDGTGTTKPIKFQFDSATTLILETNGTLNVSSVVNYETLVTHDDDIPNKKYVDDNIGISSVIADTTPQLGGDLDIQSFKILGNFNGVPLSNRAVFQDRAANALTSVAAIPNGTSNLANFVTTNNSDFDNCGYTLIGIDTTKSYVQSKSAGTGSTLPFQVVMEDTVALTVDTNRKLYTGTTPPVGAEAGAITISTGDSGVTSAVTNADDLIIENNGDTGISLLSSTTNTGYIVFGDSGDADIGRIQYNHSNNAMIFWTNGSPCLTIESNQTLNVSQVTNYENLVTADDDIPNKKYVDDAITTATDAITQETVDSSKVTTSGTTISLSTTIPSGTTKIVIAFNSTSTNGTSDLLIQIGDSGGYETTGYSSQSVDTLGGTSATSNNGFVIDNATAAATLSGIMELRNVAGNQWVESHTLTSGTTTTKNGAGAKTLTATLDRIQLTTANGTDTFDFGDIRISYS